jgi:hypothetical protein
MDLILRKNLESTGMKLNEKIINSRKQAFIDSVKKHSDVYYTSSKAIGLNSNFNQQMMELLIQETQE